MRYVNSLLEADRVRTGIAITVTAFAIVWVALNIIVWSLDFPFWDQWEFVAFLADYQQHGLSLATLFAQHNEHRPFFPRLIWLALAITTDYNTKAELWVNFLLAGATLGLFISYTLWVWKRLGQPSIAAFVFIPLVTLLTFNMVQWESWLTGFQAVMYLGMMCVIAGFIVLVRYPTWTGFAGAVALGVVGVYSMANALLYWPIGLLLLITLPKRSSRTAQATLWLAIGALVMVMFFTGWHSPQVNVASIGAINPVTYVHWMLNFLGAALLAYPPAFIFGILSLALLGWIGYRGRSLLYTPEAMPYIAIILFILGSAAIIALGRSHGGAHLALAPRYVTMTSWYWAAIIALWSLVPARPALQKSVLAVIALVLLLSTAGGAVSGYKWRYLRTLPAVEAVRGGNMPSDEMITAIYNDIPPDVTKQRLQYVCSQGWSVCRQLDTRTLEAP